MFITNACYVKAVRGRLLTAKVTNIARITVSFILPTRCCTETFLLKKS
jgi:hypothetical protein